MDIPRKRFVSRHQFRLGKRDAIILYVQNLYTIVKIERNSVIAARGMRINVCI